MKKIVLGIFIAFTAIVANAEYLYWGVTSAEASQFGANGAILWWNSTESQSGAKMYDNTMVVPYDNTANIGSVNNGYFYVELVNYTTAVDYTSKATGTYVAYSELAGARISNLSTELSALSMVMTYNGAQATPEPTSGLLMLMGFAMLGLKRKKEV